MLESDNDDWKWPSEQAERVKLLLPKSYQEKSQTGKRTCVFRFDEDRRHLVIGFEDNTEERFLDIIDPRDIIGVNIEIKLNDDNLISPSDKQGEPSHPNTNSAADNEPKSDKLCDTQAVAVLFLYVYPKEKTCTKGSILRFCGNERNRSKGTEEDIFSPDSMDREDNLNTMYPKNVGHRYGHHRRFQVVPVEDFTDLSTLVNAIRRLCRLNPSSETKEIIRAEERILVIVNPYSGRKMGVHIYDTMLRPMLEQAGIAHDCLITTHAKHAEERMKKQSSESDFRDILEYTGLVLVGGDGMIHEALQGIHQRDDRVEILERVKLGTIGAGTSNGFSASLSYASKEKHSPLDSAFLIVKGISSRVDLSRYETKSTSYLSFLTFSWAMIADIDIESECIRWAGFLRMDIWGVLRVLFLRKYRAKFSYLPPSETKTPISIPPLNKPIPDSKGWVTCEDDFILFWASQVTHAGEQMFHAPPCKLNDGVFHIMIVRGNVSRLRLAYILLSMEHGGHVDMTGVEFIKCSAYRLEPITKGSFNDLDGEVIEDGPIQAVTAPLSLRAYCNPLD